MLQMVYVTSRCEKRQHKTNCYPGHMRYVIGCYDVITISNRYDELTREHDFCGPYSSEVDTINLRTLQREMINRD